MKPVVVLWKRTETYRVVQENLLVQVDQVALGCILGLLSHL